MKEMASASSLHEHILKLERLLWDSLTHTNTASISQPPRQPSGEPSHGDTSSTSSTTLPILPLLSPNCVMIFPGGMILTSQSTPSISSNLERRSFAAWTSYSITDPEILELGEKAVMIYYDVVAKRQNPNPEGYRWLSFSAVCASTWVKDGEGSENGSEDGSGGWRLVSHQQTLS